MSEPHKPKHAVPDGPPDWSETESGPQLPPEFLAKLQAEEKKEKHMGGKPNPGTPADKRLNENKNKPVPTAKPTKKKKGV